MTFTAWPFSGFDSEVSRLRDEFLRTLGAPRGAAVGVFPAVNIYDDGQTFLVRAELPGIDKDALEITARGDQLVIRGERKVQAADSPASYHRREREGGQFRRVVQLPQRVDSAKVMASYKNGVLEVTLPRVAEAQPRRIEVS